MFSQDKIISYQLDSNEFTDVQRELDAFYELDIPYGNPHDKSALERGLNIHIPKLHISYVSFGENVIDMHNLKYLKKIILKYAPTDNCYIGQSWATDMKVGTMAALHNHVFLENDLFLCGVYYHDVDPSDTQIHFASDEMQTQFVAFEMKPGKLMFWPTEYVHGIPLKSNPTKRRSVSFNLYKNED